MIPVRGWAWCCRVQAAVAGGTNAPLIFVLTVQISPLFFGSDCAAGKG